VTFEVVLPLLDSVDISQQKAVRSTIPIKLRFRADKDPNSAPKGDTATCPYDGFKFYFDVSPVRGAVRLQSSR
jgi:hypothetical protein